MTKTKVILEMTEGQVIALHSNEDVDIHIVDWDVRGDEPNAWEKRCKMPLGPDRLVDKNFDYYMNEVLNA